MCGIVGYFRSEKSNKYYDLTEAAEAIRSRGPDESNIVDEKGFHVAFNRLSINDLSPRAMQPFRMDGVITYMNGEIYNHLELKEKYSKEFTPKTTTDTEIIPFLYKKYGMDFLNQINGMFAIVIIDQNIKKNFLVLDRFGVKPMYYTLRDGNLLFASEMKALRKVVGFDLDKRNTNIAFNIACLPYPLTQFKGMFKVSPGSFIEFKNGEITEKRWYFMNLNEQADDIEYIEDKFDKLFEKSIKYRLRSDVPVGAFLSGGLDSSSIVIEASRMYNKDFHVFNGVIDGKENTTDNVNAMRLAKERDLIYHKVNIDKKFYEDNLVFCANNFDEIMFEAGVMNFYAIQKEAKKYVTVMLDGIGGDELFLGYPKYVMYRNVPSKLFSIFNRLTPASQTMKYLMTCIHRKGSKVYDAMVDKSLFFLHAQELIPSGFFWKDSNYDEDYLREIIKRNLNVSREVIKNDELNSLGYFDYFNITGLQNVFSDRTGMAYSIEGRNPYEDYELVEFALSIRSDIKIDRSLTKKLFRQIHKKRLPDYILNAPKMGFSSPIYKWLFSTDLYMPYKRYIENNKHIIIDIIGKKAYERIMNYKIYRGTGTRWHMFMAYIMWYKINVENIKLNDTNISIYDFMNSY